MVDEYLFDLTHWLAYLTLKEFILSIQTECFYITIQNVHQVQNPNWYKWIKKDHHYFSISVVSFKYTFVILTYLTQNFQI